MYKTSTAWEKLIMHHIIALLWPHTPLFQINHSCDFLVVGLDIHALEFNKKLESGNGSNAYTALLSWDNQKNVFVVAYF